MAPATALPLHDWLQRVTARAKALDILVWAIAAMSALIVAGFVYAEQQQRELVAITEQAREMRRARQALMEVDSAVVHAATQLATRGAAEAYFKASERLAKHGVDHFPATTARKQGAVATGDLVAGLKETWAQTWDHFERGDFAGARQVYMDRQAAPALADLVTAMYGHLDGMEVRYAQVNGNIAFMTSTILVLQILTGIACAVAFRRSARHMQRESEARARAVTSANASREQVLRLFEMADVLQSATDFKDAKAVLTATATDLMPSLGGALYVFNNSRDRLVLSASWGLAAQQPGRSGWRAGRQEALPEQVAVAQCWALKRGKPHINRPQSHKLCCEHHSSGFHVLELPMIARGEILGMLQIFAGGDGAEAQLDGVRPIGTALADAMSLALSSIQLREKLRSQALRDPLTGLYNRRYMEDTLERLAYTAERENRECAVIMIDLDHFKRLNDQHGHAKGDAVLRDTAAAITSHIRDTDMACRYGGEELIVLLPNCGLEAAANKAEGIRASIASLSEPNGAQVSASIGVAALPATATTAKDLVANADAALYRAKQAGRNRVMRAAERNTAAGGPEPANDTTRDDGPSPLIAAE